MITRRTLLGGALALGATLTRAQVAVPLPERFSSAAIKADLRLLRHVYALLHPGLYRYQTPSDFDRQVETALAWAARDRTPAELYLMLSRLTARVRCGHSYANPFNQRGLVQRELLGRADRLPLCTAWLDGRLVVTDPLASGLARGTLVEQIDGQDAPALLRAMLPLTRADGSNNGKRVAQLELRQGDRFATFDLFRSLLQPTMPGVVRLRIREPGGRARTVECATIVEAKRGTPSGEDPRFGWRFAIDAHGIGLLTMPNWGLYNSKWDWRGYLDEVADAVIDGKARGLIIDLRDNEGGLDCGDVLLSRLIARPISRPPGRRLVRFRETPLELRPVLDTWDQSFHTLGAEAPPAADRPGCFELPAEADDMIVPRGRRFGGPVAVLIGPVCSSATFGFANLVKSNAVATLVGTTTGGNRRGINGGRYFFVRLPETRMEVDLPLVGYCPQTREPDAGIHPDKAVTVTRGAIIAGRDDALAAARAVLG